VIITLRYSVTRTRTNRRLPTFNNTDIPGFHSYMELAITCRSPSTETPPCWISRRASALDSVRCMSGAVGSAPSFTRKGFCVWADFSSFARSSSSRIISTVPLRRYAICSSSCVSFAFALEPKQPLPDKARAPESECARTNFPPCRHRGLRLFAAQ
jgi:hypothetical protein